MEYKKIILVSFLFVEFLFKYINSIFSSPEALQCLQKNVFNNLINSSKIIGSPSICHSVSSQCCFINLTHYYGDYLLTQEYCHHLNVNITEFTKFLQDLYEDDEKYYANFTAHNLDMYQVLGRNLDYKLLDRLNCFIGPKSNIEYSTYEVKNCKEFKDGICTGIKNNTEMDIFINNFHAKYSNAYCNKNENDKSNKCVRYDGSRSNDKMVLPLLAELRDYLQADNDEYLVVNNETNVDINPDIDYDDDGEHNFITNWTLNHKFIKNCKPRPEVKIEVICPEGYIGQNYIEFCFIYFILLLLFII